MPRRQHGALDNVDVSTRFLDDLGAFLGAGRHCRHRARNARGLDRFDVQLVVDAERVRERDGVRLHASDVAVRDVVLRIDRHGERFDGREIEAILVLEVAMCIIETPEGSAQREMARAEQRQNHRDRRQPDFVDQQDRPIDGLYATGNITATVMGRRYLGPGASIANSMVFGYVAARHATGEPRAAS